jgi:hypothetical protein
VKLERAEFARITIDDKEHRDHDITIYPDGVVEEIEPTHEPKTRLNCTIVELKLDFVRSICLALS